MKNVMYVASLRKSAKAHERVGTVPGTQRPTSEELDVKDVHRFVFPWWCVLTPACARSAQVQERQNITQYCVESACEKDGVLN